MGHDLRFPLGLTFLSTGLLLAGYGVWTRGSTLYAISEGENLNLIWGLVMAAFGTLMLALSWGALPRHQSRRTRQR